MYIPWIFIVFIYYLYQQMNTHTRIYIYIYIYIYKSTSKCYIILQSDRGSTVVKVLCYKSEGRLFDPSWVSLEFFINIKSFRSHYGSGVDSASNRNEYQEYFLGVKAAGA